MGERERVTVNVHPHSKLMNGENNRVFGFRALANHLGQSQYLLAIAVGMCCSAVLLATTGSTLIQAGGVDAYVYAGYAHDYPALLERFGPTYYSERIAYIYLERAFAYLFGLEGGYLALRFVALASAVTAVCAIGLRFYGFAPALLVAVWLSFVPWLPRSLMWTYVDGFSVVYLLVGMALLLVPTNRRLISHAAAGAVFALAVDCNLFALAVGGLVGPGWLYFYRREGLAWLVRAVLAVASGFAVAYVIMALLVYADFPGSGLFSFERGTIQTALGLLGGTGERWFEPLSSLIWEHKSFMQLIPITFAAAALLAVACRPHVAPAIGLPTDFEILAISYLAGIICFLLFLHFAFHDGVLSVMKYRAYLVPGCVLALLVLCGEAQRLGGRLFGNIAVFGGTGLIILSWLAHPVVPLTEFEFSWAWWLGVAAVSAAAAAVLNRTAVASVALVGGAVLLSLCLYDSDDPNGVRFSFYNIRDIPHQEDVADWDVYRGAVFLQQFVNGNLRPNQPVGFWYGDSDDPRGQWLNSIQSVYLWGYTRVFSNESSGMPLVDKDFRDSVAKYRFVVLLGLSDAEVNAGLIALTAANMPFSELQHTRFQGKTWGYTAVMIEMKTPRLSRL